MKQKSEKQNIQVAVRVRPMNKIEKGDRQIVRTNNNKEVIVSKSPTDQKYTFDKVFGPQSNQLDVYKHVAAPLIKEVLDGYNCTVFAYGQTGTGKTYTMEGER